MTVEGQAAAIPAQLQIAWLGDSPAGLSLAAAIEERRDGVLCVAAECAPIAAQLVRVAPRVVIENSWTTMLARPVLHWVLVSGGADECLEGARQLARHGIRLLVDVDSARASLLFTELTLQEAEGPGSVTPLFRLRHLPAIRQLGKTLATGALGPLRHVHFERTMATSTGFLDTTQLDRDFVNDVDLLRGLFGRFEQITAFRHANQEGEITLATTTLGGPGQPPIAWSVTPGTANRWNLTVTSETGNCAVDVDGEACRLRANGNLLSTQPRHEAERDGLRDVVAGLWEPWGPTQIPNAVPPDAELFPKRAGWDDLLRVVELQAAAAQSLTRRRTVDVLFEAPSERGMFKSQMTAAGCSLLLFTPLAMVLYLLVAAAVPLPAWVKVGLVALVFAPVGFFLAMQTLLFITRPASSESR